MITSYCRSRI